MADNTREGRLVTKCSKEMVVRMRTTIEKDCRKALRDVASSVATSHETIPHILCKDLNMRKTSLHMMSKVLTDDQKAEHIRICCDWLKVDASENIFSRVVTEDQSWVFE